MTIQDLTPDLVNRITLNFEEGGEMSYAVSDTAMMEVVEVLSKFSTWLPVEAARL